MSRLRLVLSYCAVLFTLLLLSSMALAQDCYNYFNTCSIADPYPLIGTQEHMTADQDRVITNDGTILRFLDIANADAVSELGVHDLGENVWRMASDGYLAAISTFDTLILLDWSDPTASVVIQSLPRPEGTVGLTRIGDWLLISRGADGVDLYECTVGGGLVFLGNADTPGEAQDAALHEGWLVVADTSALQVWNITNPATPVLSSNYDNYWVYAEDRNVSRILSGNDYLAVACIRWQGEEFGGPTEVLETMSVNGVGQLTRHGTMYYSGGWPGFDVVGDILHVGSRDDYLIYGLADFPVILASWENTVAAIGPVVACTATAMHRVSHTEFSVYDVRYPYFVGPDPAWSGSEFDGIAGGYVESGFMTKSKMWWSGLVYSQVTYLYDIRDPEDVTEIVEVGDGGGPDDFSGTYIADTDTDRVLLASYSTYGSGCALYDLSSGTTVQTSLPYSEYAVFAGSRIYQVVTQIFDSIGLAALDASTPGVITELGFIDGNFSGKPFALDQNTVAVTDGNLKILDFTDPVNPFVRSSLPAPSGTIMARHGDLLYLRTTSGFVCVDISDLDAINQLWLEPGMSPRHLEFNGDLAVVTTNYALQIFDLVGDPTGPVALSSSIPQEDYTSGTLWVEDYLYTSKMLVYDVSVPDLPVFVGRGRGASCTPYLDGDLLVTGAGCYPVQCTVSGVEGEPSLPGPLSKFNLRASPNPFNPQTFVSFVMPRAGEVRLAVYDLSGRRVRTLLHGHLDAGPQTVRWDGRDDRGQGQASGVYFSRLEFGVENETAKLVLVR
jgi:hypothetical protein